MLYSLSTLIEHIDSVILTDDIWTSNLSKYRNVCSRHAAFVIANCFQNFVYADIFEHVVLFSTSWIVIMSSYIQDISKNHFLVQHQKFMTLMSTAHFLRTSLHSLPHRSLWILVTHVLTRMYVRGSELRWRVDNSSVPGNHKLQTTGLTDVIWTTKLGN